MDKNTGLIHIYCGNGKGKTTAAMGLALRSAGRGRSVIVAQFLKDGDTGEITALAAFPNVKIITGKCERGFTAFMSDEQQKKIADECTKRFNEICSLCESKKADIIVLDEILDAVNCGFIHEKAVEEFLSGEHGGAEIVLTGRNPKPSFTALADYISEVNKIKHPYDRGVAAREGIEK